MTVLCCCQSTSVKEWKFGGDTTQLIVVCYINRYSSSHCIFVQLVSSKFPIVVKIGHAHSGSGKVSCFAPLIVFISIQN